MAYVSQDLKLARRLCDALDAIQRAIEISDAFVACFSQRSIAKHGQLQSELRYALDCARLMPLDKEFLIPVRLEACDVPRRISDQVQYVDLFPDWERGVHRVVQSVRRAARRRGKLRLCA